MALSERQQKFVDLYLASGNATESYRQAGYKCKTPEAAKAAASRLLTNVNVVRALEEARQARAQRAAELAEVSEKYVLSRLQIEAEREGESAGFITARLTALKMLGEYLGMFGESKILAELAALKKQLDEGGNTQTGRGDPVKDSGETAAVAGRVGPDRA